MEFLTMSEMEMVNGGALETVSDWLLMAGSVCMCFAAPQVGVPMVIITSIWS